MTNIYSKATGTQNLNAWCNMFYELFVNIYHSELTHAKNIYVYHWWRTKIHIIYVHRIL